MKRYSEFGLALSTTAVVLLGLVCFKPRAQGQPSPPHAEQGSILDAVGLPGQMWSATGTYSPVEKNNVISQWNFQQSAVVYSGWHNSLTFTPYIEIGCLI